MSNRSIRLLSPVARGVTVDIMCMMMEGAPYGTLNIEGVVYDIPLLSKSLDIPGKELMVIIDEIISVGRDMAYGDEGALYSRYMITEKSKSEKRKAIGAMGGNPLLLKNTAEKVPQHKVNPDKYIAGTDPIPGGKVTITEKPEIDERSEAEKVGEYYLSKKGRKLQGTQLVAFDIFWNDFDYKSDRANAADAWLDLKVNKETFDEIIKGARREAARRPGIIGRGGTPKMAQGWLSSRRWEDE